ncbi:MAG: bifunctional tetrahydrofolate synthase/dihydrofolate synthase [Betaproteobacteria bacterium]|nr:bifunctional tetrahydrofolate synthase/dihydrofolate synthase [Betaproteobacteria bacterium]
MSTQPTSTFSLQQWLSYQQALHQQVIELGLERVKRVARKMGLTPHCPVITVAGTNGKGSTCAFLNTMLMEAGYSTGVYTSPHLVRYNERIKLGNQWISDELLCQHFQTIEEARGEITLTPFEFGTLAAVSIFIEQRVDVMILEVGLGGRLDAVNIFTPSVSVVTSIGIDHVEYLGDNREDIGREKAGIFRAGVPALCADPDPPYSLIRHAQDIGAPLSLWGRDFSLIEEDGHYAFSGFGLALAPLPPPALEGDFQRRNAAAAIAALVLLKEQLSITLPDYQQALKSVFISGRYQVIKRHCLIVLDVAHNPHGALELRKNLIAHPVSGRTWMVFGMLKDKDMKGVVECLKEVVDEWHVASVPDPRGATDQQLSEIIIEQGGQVFQHPSFVEALETLFKKARPTDRIVVTGSFVTVGLIAEYLA